jgi:hypothetical protein
VTPECLRRRMPCRPHPVEVHPLQMWEIYCPTTARVIATFECRKEAEAYANTVNTNNGHPAETTSKHERCCQDG